MGNWKLWGIMVYISRLIQNLYSLIMMPLRKYSFRMIIRFPFSSFYFRPLFLNEVYMALGFWEPYVRKTLILNKGDVFVDVGAHIGYYTLYASRKVGKDGSVIAIEPDERNLSVLYKNIKAAEANNVRVIEAAAGSEDSSLYLVPRQNPLVTGTTKEGGKYFEQKEIKSICLNSLIGSISVGEHSRVFIKIDVEGGEIDVIRGGLSFVKRYHPILIIESWKLPPLQEALEEIGYNCSRLFRTYYYFSPVENSSRYNIPG